MLYDKIRNNQNKTINQLNGASDSLPNLVSLRHETDNKVVSNLVKKGWVLLYRQLWDDEDFPEEPFTERLAWIWLFSEACYEDKAVRFHNKAVHLKRGQLVTSLRILAKRFKWTKNKVDSYLANLEKFGKIIRHRQDRYQTIITVCKYGTYQDRQDTDGTSNQTQAGHRRDTGGTGLKKVKEDKKVKRSKEEKILPHLKNLKIKQSIFDELKEDFPKVDHEEELKKADLYRLDKPSKSKTPNDHLFLRNWFENSIKYKKNSPGDKPELTDEEILERRYGSKPKN